MALGIAASATFLFQISMALGAFLAVWSLASQNSVLVRRQRRCRCVTRLRDVFSISGNVV
jgi:predicted Kef-type K+ transport protein